MCTSNETINNFDEKDFPCSNYPLPHPSVDVPLLYSFSNQTLWLEYDHAIVDLVTSAMTIFL